MSLGLFITAASVLTPHSNYKDAVVTSEQLKEITSKREETKEQLLTSLKFNGHKVYYAQANKTWYYSIVGGEDKAYTPNIETNDRAVKLAFYGETTINDSLIASGKTVNFIAYTDKEYAYYELAITKLPLITISHEQEILAETDVDMSFELFDNRKNALKRIIQTEGSIHYRGATSKNLDKRSYRLNLREKSIGEHNRNSSQSLLGMREDDDWILYAPYNDGEKIRNQLSEELWYEATSDHDIQTGVEAKFVEVIENGKFAGIYSLSTTIDEKALGIGKNSDGTYSDFIFKKNSTLNTCDETENVYELKTDKIENVDNAWDTLCEYHNKSLVKKDTEYIKQHSNIDSIIDVSLFNILINNHDFAATEINMNYKNTYLIFRKSTNSYIVSYIPWDFDGTWGKSGIKDEIIYYFKPTKVFSQANFILDIINNNNIEKQTKERYEALRQSYWSNNNIQNLINKYESDIYKSGAYIREKAAWPNGSYIPDDEPQNLNRFREYVKKRLEYTDYYYGLTETEPEPLDWSFEE